MFLGVGSPIDYNCWFLVPYSRDGGVEWVDLKEYGKLYSYSMYDRNAGRRSF